MLDTARRGGKNPSCAARLPSCAASSTALSSSELGTLSGMARTDDAGRLAEIVRIMGMGADSWRSPARDMADARMHLKAASGTRGPEDAA